jgi:hypothetical protein
MVGAEDRRVTTGENPMKPKRRLGLLAALAFSVACSSTGTAVGELETPQGEEHAVTLTWKSDALDPARGRISGTLPDGTHYSGRYFEVVKTAAADTYGPAWEGWSPYWPEWGAPWHDGSVEEWDWPTFVEIYTGRVIANLQSDDHKQRLRCRFTITEPFDGLRGGGTGDCQLSNGESVVDVVLAPSR